MSATSTLLERIGLADAAITAPLTIPEDRRAPRLIALLVAHSGDSFVLALLLLSAWLFGGRAWRTPLLLTVVGLLLGQLATSVIKAAVRRRRPAGKDGRIYRRYDPYSFPSGHAARAAMLSILCAMFAPLPVLIAVLAWSPVMVLSRIAVGIHYVFDVIVGALMGAVLTYIVVYGLGGLVKLL